MSADWSHNSNLNYFEYHLIIIIIINSFVCYIAGTVGTSSTSDIAIDDVVVKQGACGTPTDCNFEPGFCLWTNVKKTDDFDWLRGKGATLSRFTGPTVDHTIGTDKGLLPDSTRP